MISLVWFGTVCLVCWDIIWYCLVWFDIAQHCAVWCFVTVLVQDEVWYRSRGSFMPDSVSLVRLELGKFSADESRSIS